MSQYNLAFIGYGGMAGWHHQNLCRAPQVNPFGVYDIDPERTAVGVSKGLKGYDTADQLLADPDVDIVITTCPNNFHGIYAIDAMRAGKHVIMEKPATITSAEFEQVMEVAEATGMQLSVHQNRRWDTDYLTVSNAIRSGLIGTPYLLKSRVLGSRGIPEGWRTHAETGGGMMLDWGVHLLDQIIHLTPHRLTEVNCRMHHTLYQEVDDGFIAKLLFANDFSATVEVDTSCFVGEDRWHVRGDLGTLQIKNWDLDGQIVRALDKTTNWEEEILYTSAGPTKTMAPRTRFSEERAALPVVEEDWINFYHNYTAALEDREDLLVKPEQVLYIIKVMEACFASDRQRETIRINF